MIISGSRACCGETSLPVRELQQLTQAAVEITPPHAAPPSPPTGLPPFQRTLIAVDANDIFWAGTLHGWQCLVLEPGRAH